MVEGALARHLHAGGDGQVIDQLALPFEHSRLRRADADGRRRRRRQQAVAGRARRVRLPLHRRARQDPQRRPLRRRLDLNLAQAVRQVVQLAASLAVGPLVVRRDGGGGGRPDRAGRPRPLRRARAVTALAAACGGQGVCHAPPRVSRRFPLPPPVAAALLQLAELRVVVVVLLLPRLDRRPQRGDRQPLAVAVLFAQCAARHHDLNRYGDGHVEVDGARHTLRGLPALEQPDLRLLGLLDGERWSRGALW
mmetsp:Transcript_32070/g.79895  ORF Transcript_32070/g.79895 Transcript_32070/m.79895 type:complete len:251 (+) Transcript_32070:459-1211(+)